MSSCEKDYTEFYSDNRPEIPVTFEGATTHGFNPYIIVPLSNGNISFTLTIPETSGRTIASISRVHAGATSINAGGVRAATYLTEPIAGNGTRATFTTSIDEFRSKSAANNTLIQNFINNATLTQLEIAYMFLVTLDNGQEIIPVQTRVWIRK
ncbi:hypothetical protein M8998_08475 [Sphingobacterium sp. lm-10]|uniref:hypothetical protein n=1 Tax=Sphingobacterium sp. lm-10 TaxID=2944904 RepID=UPI0020220463|nr:hypothetical protein [Sphingobacterium sp. lm-10]MCL7987971.1 hypothetical protein [Sphingobacterium sp. lm-10]